MTKVLITGTWTVSWDTDQWRKDWGEDTSDEDILKECIASVEQDWNEYARDPDTADFYGELVA